ncbi:MAG TPA: MmcQ/YjbR family DNA-binding protein [Steroidobacteraceae bacterium]|nr:MmcQ/YjbR family DNA-binding protein [Steroidobacteraceae bacterium]
MPQQSEDPRLGRLSEICLSLPETERTLCGAHADFRVRGRIFAYYLDGHLGDRITAACFRAAGTEHQRRVALDPVRFYLPRRIGAGWIAARLDIAGVDWTEIAAMAAQSYALVPPQAAALAHAMRLPEPFPVTARAGRSAMPPRLKALMSGMLTALPGQRRPRRQVPQPRRPNAITSASLVRITALTDAAGVARQAMGPLLRPVASLTGRTVTPRTPRRGTQLPKGRS